MIVNRWGKYRALQDFPDVARSADVRLDEVIDVTGVLCGTRQVMWLCRGRVSDWNDWDLPVEPVENQPHHAVRETRPKFSEVKRQMREDNLQALTADAREGKPTALAVIRSLRVHANAGETGAIEALVELQSSLTKNRQPTTDNHPKCLTCPHSSAWDSSGVGYCTQPLGIASLFDEHTRFPVTDEQYCSNHPECK